MTKFFVAAVAVLACLSMPAFAKTARPAFKAPPGGKLILCQMTTRPRGDWIQPEVVLLVDKAGKALAYDPIIAHFHGQPLAAKVSTDNARRTTYTWTVKGARDNSSQYAPNLDYNLTIIKADGRASLFMRPRNYNNTFRGDGACREQ